MPRPSFLKTFVRPRKTAACLFGRTPAPGGAGDGVRILYRNSVKNTMHAVPADKVHKTWPGSLAGQKRNKTFKTLQKCVIIFVKYATKAEKCSAGRK